MSEEINILTQELDSRKMVLEEQKGDMWRPHDSDDPKLLFGEVITIKDHPQYGVQLEILCQGESLIKTPFHRILQDRITDFKVGDYIVIEYKGIVKGKNRESHNYKVSKGVRQDD